MPTHKPSIRPTAEPQGDLHRRVLDAINHVRPVILEDGGDVELLDISDGIARVRLMGACVGCPSSQMTLKDGLERNVRASVPEIKAVVAVN
jgi:Fe-S cluster biogenesis protein NfuA